MSTSTQIDYTREYFQETLKRLWPLDTDLATYIDMVFDEVKSRKKSPTMTIQALVFGIIEIRLSAIDMNPEPGYQHEVLGSIYKTLRWLVLEIT